MRIYDGEKNDRFDLESRSYLQINSCGYNSSHKEAFLCIRRSGRQDFHILYVTEGELEIVYSGEKYTLSKGGFVLYRPFEPQEYRHYKLSETVWLHFNGFQAEQMVEDAALEGGVYAAEYSGKVRRLFDAVINEERLSGVSSGKGYLLTLLYELGKLANAQRNMDERIAECVAYIHARYAERLDNDALAGICHMSRSRFIEVFRSQTGMPPQAYLMRTRMEAAQELLSSSELGVARIAALCGFEDPLYFSRAFRKKTGLSPRAFRNDRGRQTGGGRL